MDPAPDRAAVAAPPDLPARPSTGSCCARCAPAPDDRYLTAGRDARGLRLRRRHATRARRCRPARSAPPARTPSTGRSGSGARSATTTSSSRPLGAGGFGRVYRVRDLHLEREVALKVLHPYLTAEPPVVERFRREAQLAARLHHPNIVDIYDIAGRAGLLWYTMELVKGPNLAQLVEREGPLPAGPACCRLLREALLRARPRPRRRAGPPRHQAGEPAARTRRHAPDHRLRPGAGAARRGPVRRRHQPERHARSSPAPSSSSASGWTSAATSTAWPRWRTSSCSGETALPRRHAGTDPRPPDHRPVPGAARPRGRTCRRRSRACSQRALRNEVEARATPPPPSSCRRSSAPWARQGARAERRMGPRGRPAGGAASGPLATPS